MFIFAPHPNLLSLINYSKWISAKTAVHYFLWYWLNFCWYYQGLFFSNRSPLEHISLLIKCNWAFKAINFYNWIKIRNLSWLWVKFLVVTNTYLALRIDTATKDSSVRGKIEGKVSACLDINYLVIEVVALYWIKDACFQNVWLLIRVNILVRSHLIHI